MFDTLTKLLNTRLTATAEVKPKKRGKNCKYLPNADHSVRYARQLAQAKFRSEAYELTPTEWLQVWRDSGKLGQWGTGRQDYSMIRINPELPWRVDNVCIITRRTHACNYKKRYAARDWTVDMYAQFDETDKIRTENPS